MLCLWSRFTVLSIFSVLTLCSLLFGQAVTYKVVPINSPFDPPGRVSANGFNKYRAVAAVDRLSGRARMGFIWRAGKGTPFPTLGGTCSSANGISDHGHVAGSSCLPGDVEFHATLYRSGHLLDLGTFGGIYSSAGRVNKTDQVTGSFTTSGGAIHSIFWQRGKWKDLGFLGGSETFAYGLSESGVVTGQSDISNDPHPVFGIPPFHGFVWSNGTLTDMGQVFGSDFGYTVGVDSAGRIAGASDLAGDLGAHAYVLDNGTVTDLTPYGDGVTSWSNGINSQGDVIGSWGFSDNDPADGPPVNTMLCPCYAVVWHNGQPTFLNDVVDPQWNLLLGLHINDRGDIVARGSFNGGPLQTVLLKPIVTASPTTSRSQLRQVEKAPIERGFHREHDGSITAIP